METMEMINRRHLLAGAALVAVPLVPALAVVKESALLAAFNRWHRGEVEIGAKCFGPEWSDAEAMRACERQDALIREIAALPTDGYDGLVIKVAILLHVQNSPDSHGDPLIRWANFQGDFQEDVLQRSLLVDVQARFPELGRAV